MAHKIAPFAMNTEMGLCEQEKVFNLTIKKHLIFITLDTPIMFVTSNYLRCGPEF